MLGNMLALSDGIAGGGIIAIALILAETVKHLVVNRNGNSPKALFNKMAEHSTKSNVLLQRVVVHLDAVIKSVETKEDAVLAALTTQDKLSEKNTELLGGKIEGISILINANK